MLREAGISLPAPAAPQPQQQPPSAPPSAPPDAAPATLVPPPPGAVPPIGPAGDDTGVAGASRHGQGGAFSSYDALAAAALRQGLLRQRDPKGRFIPKQQLARYAAELVRRGIMAAPPGADVPAAAEGGGPAVDDAELAWAGAPVGASPLAPAAGPAGPAAPVPAAPAMVAPAPATAAAAPVAAAVARPANGVGAGQQGALAAAPQQAAKKVLPAVQVRPRPRPMSREFALRGRAAAIAREPVTGTTRAHEGLHAFARPLLPCMAPPRRRLRFGPSSSIELVQCSALLCA
jgi:hypothetical protein